MTQAGKRDKQKQYTLYSHDDNGVKWHVGKASSGLEFNLVLRARNELYFHTLQG